MAGHVNDYPTNQGKAGADETPTSELKLGISEASDVTGISAYTIRYYDKCGFLPNLERNHRGVRTFHDPDIMQLNLIEALRKSGLSIEGIQYFVRLQKRGSETRSERLSILRSQETVLEYQRAEIGESLKRLHAAAVDLEVEESRSSTPML